MKRVHFPSWARPGEFHARLNQQLGRKEEARDSARVALYTPWWTLKHGFASMAELAQFPADAYEVDRLLSEVTKASQGGALPAGIAVAVKTDDQVWHRIEWFSNSRRRNTAIDRPGCLQHIHISERAIPKSENVVGNSGG